MQTCYSTGGYFCAKTKHHLLEVAVIICFPKITSICRWLEPAFHNHAQGGEGGGVFFNCFQPLLDVRAMSVLENMACRKVMPLRSTELSKQRHGIKAPPRLELTTC